MEGTFQYVDLDGFTDFNGITDDRYFYRVPRDWSIFITDVKGSTKAIEQGRYKDVNTIGAASITVARNVIGKDFPYVFGGDGATLLVPPSDLDTVMGALKSLQELSSVQFGLGLRVGHILVREVEQSGAYIEVAKHELVKGKFVAVFRGGGLALAEKMIKGDEARYSSPDLSVGDPDLTGLSCRWNKIPNKRGKVLSLLVTARGQDSDRLYAGILQFLNNLFDGDFNVANPVNTESLEYKSVQECINDEKRYEGSRFSWRYFYRVFEIIMTVLFFKWNLPALVFDSQRYKQSMRVHSDYRKFDDMLRLVIDCSSGQITLIREYLESLRVRNEIDYGMHESDNALMTCFVQDTQDGNHIHFIDGDNGGYAMAAKQMKKQISERS